MLSDTAALFFPEGRRRPAADTYMIAAYSILTDRLLLQPLRIAANTDITVKRHAAVCVLPPGSVEQITPGHDNKKGMAT